MRRKGMVARRRGGPAAAGGKTDRSLFRWAPKRRVPIGEVPYRRNYLSPFIQRPVRHLVLMIESCMGGVCRL